MKKGVSQSEVCRRLQLAGWDASRQVLGFVEEGSRAVTDLEIFCLLSVLDEKLSALDDDFCLIAAQIKNRKKL